MSRVSRIGVCAMLALAAPNLTIAQVPTEVPPAAIEVQGAAAMPAFSGTWVHPYFPGIEPPASGPKPVLNTTRRADGTSDVRRLVGDYTNPILRPHAAEVVKRHAEISLAGKTYPTPSNQCWPSGVPYIFFQTGMQMLRQANKITILYLRDHEVRHVRLNEPHPAQVIPSWYGDSVGWYQGDTLVIDTIGIRTDRPFAMIDMYGTPYSPALRVVERYRPTVYEDAKAALERTGKENAKISELLDFDPNYQGSYLQLQFTVQDEATFTMPWSATITYARPLAHSRRLPGWEQHYWEEHVCAENTAGFYSTGKDAAVPTAHSLDF